MFENLFELSISVAIVIAFVLLVWAGLTQQKVAHLMSDLWEKIKESNINTKEEISERELI